MISSFLVLVSIITATKWQSIVLVLVILTEAFSRSLSPLVAGVNVDYLRGTLADILQIVTAISRSASAIGISDVLMSFVGHDLQAQQSLFFYV
jgi:hypothetical protein